MSEVLRPARGTIEVPIDSVETARLCASIATRLEVCDDLASEGWTPREEVLRGCVDVVAGTDCTVVSMIRSRNNGLPTTLTAAGFEATPRAIDCAMREIEMSARAGAHAVAIGFLSSQGGIDIPACSRLRDHAQGLGLLVAFLRTVDLVRDRAQAMRDLAQLRVVRVVTAGVLGWDAGRLSLQERIGVLRADAEVLSHEASRRGEAMVAIVPGGGVRAANAQDWRAVSPHLHASCRRSGSFCLDELVALRLALNA